VLSVNDINTEFEIAGQQKSNHQWPLRNEAMEAFRKTGFPTTRHEEWKYTSLKDILSETLAFRPAQPSSKLTRKDVEPFMMGCPDSLIFIFENGTYRQDISDHALLPEGITVANLNSSLEKPVVKEHLNRIADFNGESFVALNAAFAEDGLFIGIDKKVRFSKPIHIIYINTTEEAQNVTSVRNLVIAEEGSEARVMESYHSLNDNCRGVTNSVTEVLVKQQANIELVKVQLESRQRNQISFTQAIQERDSIFDTVTVTLGNALVRNNLHIRLNGTNCTSHLYGLYILDGKQLVDNHTLVDHAMPHCFSNELYKGIMDGHSSGVFNGKVFVRKDAQKTNAYQSNKNILLSDNAQINTKPQLEIYADDVKCTHGATTGQLDEDALFYLRARGIGERKAKALLNIAFASDVLNHIRNEEVRHHLQNLAENKLNRLQS
jgi:Fe-S cluster assembly protein SufD